MDKKTFSEWEKISNMFALKPSKYGSKTMTREEFDSFVMADLGSFQGVQYEDRVKFLKDNGHEVTRENLLASELSAKPQEE